MKDNNFNNQQSSRQNTTQGQSNNMKKPGQEHTGKNLNTELDKNNRSNQSGAQRQDQSKPAQTGGYRDDKTQGGKSNIDRDNSSKR